MKLLKNLALLLSCVVMSVSCDKGNGGESIPEVKKVTLEASATEISVGEVCKFTVKADGKDVTASAEVYLDGEKLPLSAKEFKSDKEGSYNFYAKYDGKTSEKVTVKVIAEAVSESTLVLSVSSTQLQLNETCTFTVWSDNTDVTADSEIYSQEAGEALESNVFSPKEVGDFKFYAIYKGNKSSVVTINVKDSGNTVLPADPKPDNYSFKHRITAFFFTGLWCGNCPKGIAAIKDIETKQEYVAEKEKVTFVEVHGGDDLELEPASVDLRGIHGVNSYPNICFNMDKSTGKVYRTTLDLKNKINALSIAETNIGLSATVINKETSLIVHAAVKSSVAGRYGVGAFLVEDKIIAKQENGTGLTSYNFNEHENVLRAHYGRNSASDYSGEVKEVGEKATVSYTFSIENLQASWKLDNCRVVVYVTDDSRHIINSVICNIGEKVEFQYK